MRSLIRGLTNAYIHIVIIYEHKTRILCIAGYRRAVQKKKKKHTHKCFLWVPAIPPLPLPVANYKQRACLSSYAVGVLQIHALFWIECCLKLFTSLALLHLLILLFLKSRSIAASFSIFLSIFDADRSASSFELSPSLQNKKHKLNQLEQKRLPSTRRHT